LCTPEKMFSMLTMVTVGKRNSPLPQYDTWVPFGSFTLKLLEYSGPKIVGCLSWRVIGHHVPCLPQSQLGGCMHSLLVGAHACLADPRRNLTSHTYPEQHDGLVECGIPLQPFSNVFDTVMYDSLSTKFLASVEPKLCFGNYISMQTCSVSHL
jgi:hypothetical protein